MINAKGNIKIFKQIVFVCISIAVCFMFFAGCSSGEEQAENIASTELLKDADVLPEEATGLLLHSVEEQGDRVVVTTSYCVLAYPFAFSDLIQVDVVDDENCSCVEFRALIGEEEYLLYAILFDSEEGIYLGTLDATEQSDAVDVYAELYPVDESLNEDSLVAFMAAQETFNDVVFSLAENDSFTPAK